MDGGWSSVGTSIRLREADGSGIETLVRIVDENTEIDMSNTIWTPAQVRIWDELISTTASEGVGTVLAIIDNFFLAHQEEVEDHLSQRPQRLMRLDWHSLALNGRYQRPGAAPRQRRKLRRQPQPVQCLPSETADQPPSGAVQVPRGATSDVAPRRGDGLMVIMTIEVSADGERGHSQRIRCELEL